MRFIMKTNKMSSKQPTQVPIPKVDGYPNDIPNTQTMKTRGTGAATKGTNSSKRLA
tara:strand:+ start:1543 stop:1710 length:168 start_codon:yes stop_codon:yes gene_type:complete